MMYFLQENEAEVYGRASVVAFDHINSIRHYDQSKLFIRHYTGYNNHRNRLYAMQKDFNKVCITIPPWCTGWPAFNDIIERFADVIVMDEVSLGKLVEGAELEYGMVVKLQGRFWKEVEEKLS